MSDLAPPDRMMRVIAGWGVVRAAMIRRKPDAFAREEAIRCPSSIPRRSGNRGAIILRRGRSRPGRANPSPSGPPTTSACSAPSCSCCSAPAAAYA
ncbi:MAG: hypothetical protein U1G05_02285 [Kiritimatiellia bacterium]